MLFRLVTLAGLVFLLNLLFGYWRANVPKLTFPWFLAVHAPVPAVIALRLVLNLGFAWSTFPPLVGAFFCGQYAGGLLSAVGLKRAIVLFGHGPGVLQGHLWSCYGAFLRREGRHLIARGWGYHT